MATFEEKIVDFLHDLVDHVGASGLHEKVNALTESEDSSAEDD